MACSVVSQGSPFLLLRVSALQTEKDEDDTRSGVPCRRIAIGQAAARALDKLLGVGLSAPEVREHDHEGVHGLRLRL